MPLKKFKTNLNYINSDNNNSLLICNFIKKLKN